MKNNDFTYLIDFFNVLNHFIGSFHKKFSKILENQWRTAKIEAEDGHSGLSVRRLDSESEEFGKRNDQESGKTNVIMATQLIFRIKVCLTHKAIFFIQS